MQTAVVSLFVPPAHHTAQKGQGTANPLALSVLRIETASIQHEVEELIHASAG